MGGTVVLLGIALVLVGESSRATAEKQEEEEEEGNMGTRVGEYKMGDEPSEQGSGFTELESPSPSSSVPPSETSESMSSPSVPLLSPLMLSPRRGELRNNSFYSRNHNHHRRRSNHNPSHPNHDDVNSNNDGSYDRTGPYLKRFNSLGEAPIPALTITAQHHYRGLPQQLTLTSSSSLEEKENQGEYQYYYHAGKKLSEIATV